MRPPWLPERPQPNVGRTAPQILEIWWKEIAETVAAISPSLGRRLEQKSFLNGFFKLFLSSPEVFEEDGIDFNIFWTATQLEHQPQPNGESEVVVAIVIERYLTPWLLGTLQAADLIMREGRSRNVSQKFRAVGPERKDRRDSAMTALRNLAKKILAENPGLIRADADRIANLIVEHGGHEIALAAVQPRTVAPDLRKELLAILGEAGRGQNKKFERRLSGIAGRYSIPRGDVRANTLAYAARRTADWRTDSANYKKQLEIFFPEFGAREILREKEKSREIATQSPISTEGEQQGALDYYVGAQPEATIRIDSDGRGNFLRDFGVSWSEDLKVRILRRIHELDQDDGVEARALGMLISTEGDEAELAINAVVDACRGSGLIFLGLIELILDHLEVSDDKIDGSAGYALRLLKQAVTDVLREEEDR